MPEVWLHSNRRALAVGMIVPGLWLIAALAALGISLSTGQSWWIAALAAVLSLPPLWMLGGLAYAMTLPRLACERNHLRVYADAYRPTRVPIEIVEVFFLGQGPSPLPKLAGRRPETQNIVVRLAESATQWREREVRPAIGQWCGGYITLRGSWCEPITRELMQRLNHRLAELQRERKTASSAEPAS
jgi:hypothetical protein